MTLIDLGVEYNLRKTTLAARLIGDMSGSGLALRAGYNLDTLSFTLIYLQLKKSFEDEQCKGIFGGKLDRASKQANGSIALAVGEYKAGPSVLGLQYKLRNSDAKLFKNGAGEETNNSTDDLKIYAAAFFKRTALCRNLIALLFFKWSRKSCASSLRFHRRCDFYGCSISQVWKYGFRFEL